MARLSLERRLIRRGRKSLLLTFKARDVAASEGRAWAAQWIGANATEELFRLGGLMGEW